MNRHKLRMRRDLTQRGLSGTKKRPIVMKNGKIYISPSGMRYDCFPGSGAVKLSTIVPTCTQSVHEG